ncbi:MAG: hypothetical protein ACXVAU_03220 [Mucilaginibacter sp.]
MNQPFKVYYLYCMNEQCAESVYNFMSELEIPYASKNLIGTCFCSCCGQPLISAVEAAANVAMEEADYQDPLCTYLYN